MDIDKRRLQLFKLLVKSEWELCNQQDTLLNKLLKEHSSFFELLIKQLNKYFNKEKSVFQQILGKDEKFWHEMKVSDFFLNFIKKQCLTLSNTQSKTILILSDILSKDKDKQALLKNTKPFINLSEKIRKQNPYSFQANEKELRKQLLKIGFENFDCFICKEDEGIMWSNQKEIRLWYIIDGWEYKIYQKCSIHSQSKLKEVLWNNKLTPMSKEVYHKFLDEKMLYETQMNVYSNLKLVLKCVGLIAIGFYIQRKLYPK